MKEINKWSKKDIARLEKLYAVEGRSAAEVARRMNRTLRSVYGAAVHYGIKKNTLTARLRAAGVCDTRFRFVRRLLGKGASEQDIIDICLVSRRSARKISIQGD